MTVLWTILGILLLILWVVTLVDIFRHRYPAGKMAAYILLVVILPFVGAVIYWAVRKPDPGDAEQAYLSQAEQRRSAASRPVDRSGM